MDGSLTIDGIRCFCALVEEGSFGAAAARVHRTQPAVTQQIQRLERALGVTLFDRRAGKATPAGAALYDRGKRILNSVDDIERAVADAGGAQSRPLRLGTSDTVAIYNLPNVIKKLAATVPNARITIVNRPSSEITNQVIAGTVDLGVVAMPAETPELETRVLFEQKTVLAVPKQHAFASRKRIRLNALAGEPVLMLGAETRAGGLLRRHFAAEGFDPQVALDSGSYEVIKAHVRAGLGVGFVPEGVVGKSDRKIAIVAVQGLPAIAIGAIWRRDIHRSRSMDVFLDLLSGG